MQTAVTQTSAMRMIRHFLRSIPGVVRGFWSGRSSLFGSRSATIGFGVILVVLVCAVIPERLAPYDPNEQFLFDRLKPPLTGLGTTQVYLLGTDQLGRDVLSRVIFSARTSILIGFTAVGISGTIGVLFGLLAGYKGGIVDDLLMRLADIQLAFPFLMLAIAIIGPLGRSVQNVILVVGIANWVAYARLVRGETLAVREKMYTEAARCIGASTQRVVFNHILPNVSASIIVVATFGVGNAIMSEAGLSFLGLGVPLEIPSWGGMLADGRQFVDTYWWLAVFPGLAIFVTVLAINLLGDSLRDALDPYVLVKRTSVQQ